MASAPPPAHAAQANNGSSNLSSPSSLSTTYSFPISRLKRRMDDPSRIPLVLVACGSFSPITFLHLRMFEMAADYVKFNTTFEVVGGYLSPVSDAYKKAGLASAQHRLNMCELAVNQTSDWLMVDSWEAEQKDYMPTALVLDHFEHAINTVQRGVACGNPDDYDSNDDDDDGDSALVNGNNNNNSSNSNSAAAPPRRPVRIALLAGADLIQTMSTPGVWSELDLEHILGRYGTLIVERSGTDIEEALAGLQPWKENIHVIRQLIQNDVSSTKIRLFLRREMSVRYLIPSPVIRYIEDNGLYLDEGAAPRGAAPPSAAASSSSSTSSTAAAAERKGKARAKGGESPRID